MLLEVLTTSITLENKLFIQRDLKSSKILFGEDMHAQLLDFWIGSTILPEGNSCQTKQKVGTIGYMALSMQWGDTL